MDEYQLFPDIWLICGARIPLPPQGASVAVTYCHSGTAEYEAGGSYFYLTGGEYIVHSVSAGTSYSAQVSANYSGLTLFVSDKAAARTAAELICDTAKLVEKVRQKGHCIAQAEGELLRSFSETLAHHEKGGETWLRVRAIELLMLISGEVGLAPAERAETITAIGSFICKNISTHVTIPRLSELFGLNPTTLKNEFKRTFGCTVYAYARSRKMFLAAELLRETDRKIIDIAVDVGYCNASKFAGAFSKVIGVNPREYRERFRTEHFRSARSKSDDISAITAY
ncbi:MAG: AraC family transcriptional regulator [Ruminococcus sp.]|nr:AraC family transcriptional regulator [Ruminococcus sp.]